ncbi:hypothetical protein [Paraburkholderia sp. SIMBA_054]|uniref:hypothetical protein n=1 Tax=Paraburkholderia sp. SIMBA_054 TaxID=3085795 RepID=UPI00397DCC9A
MSNKTRRVIGIVRTHCNSQIARLFQTSRHGVEGPVFVWEAGTIAPYKPTVIGEGEIKADTAKEAISQFRKMLAEQKTIPNDNFKTGSYLSPLLVQFLPKASDDDVCVLLQATGNARLVRPPVASARNDQPEAVAA